MSEFEKNKVIRLEEYRNKLNELYEEYHAEVYLNDAIFKRFMELGNEINREILEIKGIRESK
jgi:uncharacterized protein YdcH (DUF465 family)